MPVVDSGSPGAQLDSANAADVPQLPKSLKDMTREELHQWYADLRSARHVIETAGPRTPKAKAASALTRSLSKEL